MGQKYSRSDNEHTSIYAIWYKLFGKRLYKYNAVPNLEEVFEDNKKARHDLQKVINKCSVHD